MTTTQTDPLINEDVHVSIQRKPHCMVEFHVKASSALVNAAKKDAIKLVSKEVTLPGFRKGKAPESMIEKKYPHEIQRELHKCIADLAFKQAQKTAKVPLLNQNSSITFDLKSLNESGAELVFHFETEPEVPSVDPTKFTPTPPQKAEVGEKQIEEAIRQMRYFYAEWKPITDRPIQEGDTITIDLDTFDGEAPQRVFSKVRFEVHPERMANWMRNLVLNAEAGAVLEGISEPDENASEEDKKDFQPKKVRLHILSAEQAILPEVNDEFAKKVGSENVAAMREFVTGMLNKNADDKVKEELRDQINAFFVKEYPFDLPRSLIETEKNHRHSQMMNDPNFRQKWEKMESSERKKIEDRLIEESADAVRLFYLSRKVVQEANIPITHKMIQDEAIAILNSYGMHRSQISEISREVYALALSKVILSKAQDHILAAPSAPQS